MLYNHSLKIKSLISSTHKLLLYKRQNNIAGAEAVKTEAAMTEPKEENDKQLKLQKQEFQKGPTPLILWVTRLYQEKTR